MKKYVKPEITMELLEVEDVITTSVEEEIGGGGGDYETPGRPIG